MSKSKIVLKTLKEHGNMIWHPESTLVFKSASDRKVIGRFDGKFNELDDVSLGLIDDYGFKVDPETYDRLYKESSEKNDDDCSEPMSPTNSPIVNSEKTIPVLCEEENTKELAESKVVVEAKCSVVDEAENEDKIDIESVLAKFYNTYVVRGITTVATEYQSKIDSLENRLKISQTELKDVTEKYEHVKKKFDTMKQLLM